MRRVLTIDDSTPPQQTARDAENRISRLFAEPNASIGISVVFLKVRDYERFTPTVNRADGAQAWRRSTGGEDGALLASHPQLAEEN